MNIIQYVLVSTVCISITYAGYILIFRNDTHFKQLRIYLLLSVLLSVLMPFNNFTINLKLPLNKNITETTIEADNMQASPQALNTSVKPIIGEPSGAFETNISTIDRFGVFMLGYWSVVLLLFFRIVVQIIILVIQYHKSDREKIGEFIVIRNSRFKNTFSFFNWIFLHSNDSSTEEVDQIISHEKIHASQYHSFDLILIELLAAVMWFNPVIWMMRNSMQLVHEYLADEGALSTGIDKLKYQALLINQVTEERLICLSSSFNHSLIKKRMIMMTKSKFNQGTKLKILALIPLATVLFLGVACVNGQNKSNVVTAIEPVKMNVLYIGVDNPIRIAASGYDATELTVTIDNGAIIGKNGEYIVRPAEKGIANVIVSNKSGKEIQRTEFRVKPVPDPVAGIQTPSGLKTNGTITKKELLEANGIAVILSQFDFDMNFKVESFVLSYTATRNFTVFEIVSKSDKFTEEQIKHIKGLVKNQKLTIEAITISGPDGIKRKLSPMVFLIWDE